MRAEVSPPTAGYSAYISRGRIENGTLPIDLLTLLTWRPLIVAMSVQLPLPARWAHIESRREPLDRLATLQDDLAGAKAAIKAVLEGVAARHGITARDVNEAIEGYADDMLSDMIFHVERDLEREIEGEQERSIAGDR